VGLPVAAFRNGSAVDPWVDVIHIALGATSAGLLAVTLAVLRIYLGWAYVGNRLLSATVECMVLNFDLQLVLFHSFLFRKKWLIDYFFFPSFNCWLSR
jgi:Conserved in the green lineage and diatoms 27